MNKIKIFSPLFVWIMSLLKTVHFCIRPVWTEPSLSAWRNIRPLSTQWAHCEDCNQSGQTPRLIWLIAGRTVIYSNVGGNSRHESVMISVSKEDIELPKLKVYWIPQLHKNPYKRYITGSVRCSTKPLSHTLTRILTNNAISRVQSGAQPSPSLIL